MRKLLVAGAIGVALVGAGWLGTSLVEPYEEEAAAGRSTAMNAEKKPSKPAPAAKSWAERASTSCARALEDSRAVLRDAPFTTADSNSGTEAVLRLMRTLTWIEARLLRELKRVPPSPADRRRVTAALALLTESHRHDRATVEALKESWDPALLEEAVRREAETSEQLRLLFLGTGATACVAVFDPDSY
jgi:hypothetical protein